MAIAEDTTRARPSLSVPSDWAFLGCRCSRGELRQVENCADCSQFATVAWKLIDNNHFQISDGSARMLARRFPGTVGGTKLPSPDLERRVKVNGRQAWLKRTPYRYFTDAPARGWVWCVHVVA